MCYFQGEYGNITERIKLRERLQCKSFKWYLDNIYPELFIPGEAVASGEVRNHGFGAKICLDSPANQQSAKKPLGTFLCHLQQKNQFWQMSKFGEIRGREYCLDYSDEEEHTEVVLDRCHEMIGNQR
jgi:polypeptide N-acetylgalactosaminyltransferase